MSARELLNTDLESVGLRVHFQGEGQDLFAKLLAVEYFASSYSSNCPVGLVVVVLM